MEALSEQEKLQEKQKLEEERQAQIDKELSQKAYGESLKQIKKLLLDDKTKVRQSKLSNEEKEQVTLVIDMFANAVESNEKDAVIYAFVAYRYMAKAHKILFFSREKKIGKLLKDVINEL